MVDIEKKEEFNFGVPLQENKTPVGETPPITSASIEQKIAEEQAQTPKKRGRKPGSTNKKETSQEVPEYIKQMFGPLVVALHNIVCKFSHLSALDKEQEKMVTDGYAMLLHKRAPEFLEKHGDIIAALGATAFVFGAKIASETKLFDFNFTKEKTQNGKTEQHNDDIRKEGEREDSIS